MDLCHVLKNILAALDKIRIKVMNRYDEHSINYYLLKKFNFLLLTHDNVTKVFGPLYHDFIPSSGKVTIGNNVIIGAGAVVTHDRLLRGSI